MPSKIFIMIIAVIFLTGCSQETMIHLSEENQLIVESKLNEKEGRESEEGPASDEEVQESSTSLEESSQEQETEESTEVASSNEDPSILDTSQWQVYEGSESFNIIDFLPSQAYQIKSFTQADGLRVTYPNFIDQASQLMQVESRNNGQLEVGIYNWGSSQIIRLANLTEVNPYLNHMQATIDQANSENYEIILQSPLNVGNQWQRNAEQTSEITAIYASGQLPAGEFQNIIEVTTQGDNGEYKEYYAQGQGLVAYSQEGSQGQVLENYHDSRIINSIPMTLAKQDGSDTLEDRQVNFKWQTNASLATAFDELLKEVGILDETISVQSLTFENGLVTMDFSAGVVAVLNQYPASEQAVIGSIVISLADFFGADQVRLSVNGNGMLANTVPYPNNGIYQVGEVRAWFTNPSPQDSTAPEEQTESTIELSFESE